jgi:predicted MPP superfamily phosphohydrolase
MFVRIYKTLSGTGFLRGIVCIAFLFFAVGFPLGRLLDGYLPVQLSRVLSFVGSIYLAPMLYGFILTVITDLLRLLNGVIIITPNPPPFTLSGRVSVVTFLLVASIAITLAGALNAKFITTIRHEIEWKRPGGAEDQPYQLTIALVSDIHLGGFVGAKHLKNIVELTNDQMPDIVLIAGDIFDDGLWLNDAERREEAIGLFSSFSARLGTWAIPGNHDHYAGVEKAGELLDQAGINLLRDELVSPGGELTLIGRDDRSVVMKTGKARAKLEDILSSYGGLTSADRRLPLVVMDHQPFNLDESQSIGATLQVSGHTHRGQLIPVNLAVACIFERHYGLYRKGDTSYFITSGAGTWGPPVRTSGRPEIVILVLDIT